jgi:hypothetical protein
LWWWWWLWLVWQLSSLLLAQLVEAEAEVAVEEEAAVEDKEAVTGEGHEFCISYSTDRCNHHSYRG